MILHKQYEILDKVGEGGFGAVWRARDIHLDTLVAIKALRLEDPTALREEAKILSALRHENVVGFRQLFPEDNAWYLVLDFVEGGSLASWIRSGELYKGTSEEVLRRLMSFATQSAKGLAYAHEAGIIHRDVKPANVLITPRGSAKVSDFGLARARAVSTSRDRVATANSILVSTGGMTPAYCSPEQQRGGMLTSTTDTWSWGIAVLEMFTGGVTWTRGDMVSEVLTEYLAGRIQNRKIPAMPVQLGATLKKCFQLDPHQRSKLRDLINELELVDIKNCFRFDQVVEKRVQVQIHPGLLKDLSRKVDGVEEAVRPAPVKDAVDCRTLHEHTEAISSVAFSADSGWLLLGSEDGKLFLWDLEKRSRARVMQAVNSQVTAICFAGDSRYAFVGGQSAELAMWDLQNGICTQRFGEKSKWVNSIALMEAGRKVVTGHGGMSFRVWDWSAGTLVRSIEHYLGGASLSARDDGRIALVFGGVQSSDEIWNLESGLGLKKLDKKSYNGVLSADGNWAITTTGRLIHVWNAITGKFIRDMDGDTGRVSSLALSADGNWALSGTGNLVSFASKDYVIRVWDVVAGKCVQVLKGHTQSVNRLALSRDGRWAASGSDDKTIRLWRVNLKTPHKSEKPKVNKSWFSRILGS